MFVALLAEAIPDPHCCKGWKTCNKIFLLLLPIFLWYFYGLSSLSEMLC